MDAHYIDDLCDRADWIIASIDLQSSNSEVVCAASARIEELQQRIEERNRQRDAPFQTFVRRLSLSETEQRVVMLLAAHRLGRVRGLELTLDEIRSLIYGLRPSWTALEELAPSGTLRRLALIERSDDGTHAHESKQTWSIAPRVLAMLHGRDEIDPALRRICRTREPQDLEMIATATAERALARSAVTGTAVVVACGMEGLGRATLLTAAAHAAGRRVIEVDARRLSKDSRILNNQLLAIMRECRLLAATPLVANIDALAQDVIATVGDELAGLIDGPLLVTCGPQRPKLDWSRPVIVIEMTRPSWGQCARLWKASLGDVSEQDAQHLATHYPLAPALLARAADAARARATGRKLEGDDVYSGIRAVLDDRLGQFAKRVTVTQTWEDLVLAADQLETIIELIARIRRRHRVFDEWGFGAKIGKGSGTSALFSGPPGTGKTMVAALIANDLGLELYQVDLGKVVSKYIGETEKNLAALFDAAEAGHAILLFDEADALFGKRTDVKSSNDRYANLETNYLLQRLESFTGTCLLTTNHDSNIDPAFLRRLSLHLRFDLPDIDERVRLWRAMLPKAAPVASGIDIEAFARRFAMSGGYIRNAALRAAFLAADEDSIITAVHLERAARLEYEGMGKIVTCS